MNGNIHPLRIDEYQKCSSIWDMDKHAELAARFFAELCSGNRMTWVYELDGQFLGEISLVKEKDDPDYTIPGQRVYISRLLVRKENRRQGIGKALTEYAITRAAELGYAEVSIGVDMDNYAALRLYTAAGFREILFLGEDADGKYFKLLKRLG
jgi:ribosomal protein S18 acetylase RimI-like enzyme